MEKLLTVSVAAYNGAATLQKALESCLVADESLQALLDVIIIDDMISSGESMLDVAKQLKSRNAKRIFAVMGLAVKCGQEITLKTDGENEEEAMNKLSAFLEENL